jgi:hypothetical protein
MSTLVNHSDALRVCMLDSTSAGSWNSARFLGTQASYKPAVAPEDFDVCPVLPTQPAEDMWTPRWICEVLFQKIKKVSVKIMELENAEHYPWRILVYRKWRRRLLTS